MKKESGSREQTVTVKFPPALLLIMIVAVVATKSVHAQCTRSCGGPAPNDAFSVLHNFTGPPDGAILRRDWWKTQPETFMAPPARAASLAARVEAWAAESFSRWIKRAMRRCCTVLRDDRTELRR